MATQLQSELDQAKNLAYRALEDGHSERMHLLRLGRMTTKGVLPADISATNVLFIAAPPCNVGSAAWSSMWSFALRSGVCPGRRRTRRTKPDLL